jgi:hypothetical protein
METLKTPKSRIPTIVLKALLIIAVVAAVEVLTHEPGAVVGAFAAVTAALYHRSGRRCFGR